MTMAIYRCMIPTYEKHVITRELSLVSAEWHCDIACSNKMAKFEPLKSFVSTCAKFVIKVIDMAASTSGAMPVLLSQPVTARCHIMGSSLSTRQGVEMSNRNSLLSGSPCLAFLTLAVVLLNVGCAGKTSDEKSNNLVSQLNSDDEIEQLKAVDGLARLASSSSVAVSGLKDALNHKNINVSARAAERIEELGPISKQFVPELLNMVKRGENPQPHLVETIAKLAPDTVNGLIEMVRNGPLSHRLPAMRMLGLIRAEAALPVLLEMVTAANKDIRAAASDAIIAINPTDFSFLIGLFRSTRDVSHEAAKIAAGLGEKTVPYILEKLDHEDEKETKYKLIQALEFLGPKASPATSVLIAIMKDKDADESLHLASAIALREIGPSVAPHLAKELQLALASNDTEMQGHLISALKSSRQESSFLLPIILPYLNSDFTYTRGTAVIILGQIDPQNSKLQSMAINDPDQNIRWNAQDAIGVKRER